MQNIAFNLFDQFFKFYDFLTYDFIEKHKPNQLQELDVIVRAARR